MALLQPVFVFVAKKCSMLTEILSLKPLPSIGNVKDFVFFAKRIFMDFFYDFIAICCQPFFRKQLVHATVIATGFATKKKDEPTVKFIPLITASQIIEKMTFLLEKNNKKRKQLSLYVQLTTTRVAEQSTGQCEHDQTIYLTFITAKLTMLCMHTITYPFYLFTADLIA